MIDSPEKKHTEAGKLTYFCSIHCKYMKNNAIAQAKKVISYRTICFFSPSPQSSTRRRSGGGKRWSTCIKRWNVATLSPRRRGDTARPTQGDRRKPRERRRSPRSRRVGGAGKPSVLHPDPQRGRQAVEHVHQAVERRHALPQTKGRHRAAYPRRPEEAP